MKIRILIFFIFLVSCDFKKDGSKTDTNNSLTKDEFTVFGYQELTSDLNIEAKKVIFLADTIINLGSYNLNIIAEEIEFNNSQLFSFDFNETGECEQDGKSSGNIFLNSKKTSGNPSFYLSGQKAGRNGWGYRIDDNNQQVYHPDDSKKIIDGYIVIHDCDFSSYFRKLWIVKKFSIAI
jgi:hypothetical protein